MLSVVQIKPANDPSIVGCAGTLRVQWYTGKN